MEHSSKILLFVCAAAVINTFLSALPYYFANSVKRERNKDDVNMTNNKKKQLDIYMLLLRDLLNRIACNSEFFFRYRYTLIKKRGYVNITSHAI